MTNLLAQVVHDLQELLRFLQHGQHIGEDERREGETDLCFFGRETVAVHGAAGGQRIRGRMLADPDPMMFVPISGDSRIGEDDPQSARQTSESFVLRPDVLVHELGAPCSRSRN